MQNFNAKFKAALFISHMDKESRRVDKNPQALEKEFTQTVVEHNGNKTTAFVPQLSKDVNEVNEDNFNIQGEHEPHIACTINYEQYKVPKIQGMIFKKSPHMVQGWQSRYAICDDNRLTYYLPEDKEHAFGILDFNIMSYTLQETKNKQGQLVEFVLIPNKNPKVFQFKGIDLKETTIWYNTVKENIQTSLGAKSPLESLNKYSRFWRTDRIAAEQFAKQANTADILLFRGTGTNCVVQRTFTGSEYDHAALLLRFSAGSLYIFEATGYYGVGLCSWDQMIKNRWFDLYDKIVLRRLEIDRDKNFLQIVQNFVNENMGKKYSCSPQKLLKMKSTLHPQIDKKEERTFFCSELVAALYKELNILPPEPSAAQYWPGSFSSENKKLKLLRGKLLGEQLIDFTQIK